MQKIFPKLRLQKRAEHKLKNEALTRGKNAVSHERAWPRRLVSGLLPGVSAVRPTRRSCCNAQSTELQLVSEDQSLPTKCSYAEFELKLLYHEIQELSLDMALFMKHRTSLLRQKWNAINTKYLHSQSTALGWAENALSRQMLLWSVKRSGFYSFYK